MPDLPTTTTPSAGEGRANGRRRVRHTLSRPPVVIGPLLLASMALTVGAAGPGLLPGDVLMAHEVQEITLPGTDDLARLTNWIGYDSRITRLSLVLLLFLAVCRRFAAAGLTLATMLTQSLNPLLKAVTASPRPTADLVQISEWISTPGFPSGHVMSAVLFYGAIIYLAHDQIRLAHVRHLVQVLAMFMVLATGFGRIYSGAHWPSDVIGGYLWGATLLLLLVGVHQRVRHRSGASAAGAPGS